MLAATVHVAVIATPSPAFAQSPDSPSQELPASVAAIRPPAGRDVITMKNGELLRGTVIITDAQVRIQLATGEIVTVPSQQVDHIEHGAAPPVGPVEPSPPPDKPPSGVWVHLDAPMGALLLRRTTDFADWETVCWAPCDKLLATAFRYRVGGGGISLSTEFSLSASPGTHETLTVSGASKGLFVLGGFGMVAGGIVVASGLYLEFSFVVGSYLLEVPFDWSANGSLALLAVVGLGALVFTGGAALVHASAHTTVTQHLDAGRVGSPLPSFWTKTPTWSTAPEQRNLPPAAGIPIFSGRF
jgi:hypothetical protein